MKNYLLILLFLLVSSCCKDDTTKERYCDAENPVEELDWLRIYIKDREITSDSVKVQAMNLPSFEEQGFLIEYNVMGVPIQPQMFYYTCNGTYICSSVGGVVGSDCGSKTNDIELGEVFYTSY